MVFVIFRYAKYKAGGFLGEREEEGGKGIVKGSHHLSGHCYQGCSHGA
jgi:hypothetical protein